MKNGYQIITDRIVELLESGIVPWHKPWNTSGEAMNLISRHPYRGINRFLLNVAGFGSPYWITLKQANKLGGRVLKGEKSTPVVFWKMIEVEDEETGKIEEKPVLRYYRVFNLEQTEGIAAPKQAEAKKHSFTPIEVCEQMVAGMPCPPALQHKALAAWYKPEQDLINMPARNSFESPEEYYSTLFHELAHATGHKNRLNRSTLTDMAPFGSTNYSKEELVAEMAAAFLCGATGIENRTLENSAGYLDGWLRKLRKDSRMVVIAAAQAQKAADYINGDGTPKGPEDPQG